MKKLILLLCTTSLLSVSGSTVTIRPARMTELEQSLKELELVIDSLDKAYEKAIDSGGLPDTR